MQKRPELPWEINKNLRRERLIVLARAIVQARQNAHLEYRPDQGDNSWSLGCRAYAWSCHAISELARQPEVDWLSVKEEGLYFVMYINNEPIRFYRGDADQPSARCLRSGIRELQSQVQLPFFAEEIEQSHAGWFWLMALETDDDGNLLRVVMLQADESGQTRNVWNVPLDEPVRVLAPIGIKVREGHEIPPPVVRTKIPKQRRNQNANGDS